MNSRIGVMTRHDYSSLVEGESRGILIIIHINIILSADVCILAAYMGGVVQLFLFNTQTLIVGFVILGEYLQ